MTFGLWNSVVMIRAGSSRFSGGGGDGDWFQVSRKSSAKECYRLHLLYG